MTIDGLDLLIFIAVFAFIVLAEHVWSWSRWDRDRREERLEDRLADRWLEDLG